MNEVFIGRTAEKAKFTKVLDTFVNPEKNSQKDNSPHIFLFYGTGGIGKTTLLKKLKQIAEKDFQDKFNTFFLDWEQERDREQNIGLQVGHDNIQAATVLEAIYQSFAERGWKEHFPEYRRTTEFWKEAKKKINQALESELKNETVQELRPLGADGIAELLRESQANSGEEEFKWAQEFVNYHLNSEEDEIYQNPEPKLASALGAGIANLAETKPLIIFFDTYEIIDRPECDYILRRVIETSTENSSQRVVWVIAGRSNLAESGWRNPEAKEALLSALQKENQDADVVAVAIRLLENFDDALAVPTLVNFLAHQDRYVREAAARELGILGKYETDRKTVLEQAVVPLIQLMRNNPISTVRDTARKALCDIYKEVRYSEPPPKELTQIIRALYRERENIKEDELSENIKNNLVIEREKQLEEKVQQARAEGCTGLLEGLKHTDPDIQEGSAKELGEQQRQEAVESLVDLLRQPNEDPDFKTTIAEALGSIGKSTEDVISTLIQALDFDSEPDRYVRAAAATALKELTPTAKAINAPTAAEAINALNKSARQDVISVVRNAAEKSLKHIRDNHNSELAKRYLQRINREQLEPLPIKNSDEINEIIRILESSNGSDQKIQAAQTLSQFTTPDVINALIKALEDRDPDVCAATADALGKIKNPCVLEILHLHRIHKDRIAREAIVKAIGDLETTKDQLDRHQVIDSLIDIWRNDPISNVRDAVENTLVTICKRNQHPNALKALERYPKPQDKYKDLLNECKNLHDKN